MSGWATTPPLRAHSVPTTGAPLKKWSARPYTGRSSSVSMPCMIAGASEGMAPAWLATSSAPPSVGIFSRPSHSTRNQRAVDRVVEPCGPAPACARCGPTRRRRRAAGRRARRARRRRAAAARARVEAAVFTSRGLGTVPSARHGLVACDSGIAGGYPSRPARSRGVVRRRRGRRAAAGTGGPRCSRRGSGTSGTMWRSLHRVRPCRCADRRRRVVPSTVRASVARARPRSPPRCGRLPGRGSSWPPAGAARRCGSSRAARRTAGRRGAAVLAPPLFRSMITLPARRPSAVPMVRSTLPDSRIRPSHRSTIRRLSVTGRHRARSGGKHSRNLVTRSPASLRSSARSASPQVRSQSVSQWSDSVSRAIASSTRSSGTGSPLPVDGQLDRLVGDAAPGDRHGHHERVARPRPACEPRSRGPARAGAC